MAYHTPQDLSRSQQQQIAGNSVNGFASILGTRAAPPPLPALPEANQHEWRIPSSTSPAPVSAIVNQQHQMQLRHQSTLASANSSFVGNSQSESNTADSSAVISTILRDRSRHELAELLGDSRSLDALYESSHPSAVSHASSISSLAHDIEDLAKSIKSREPILESSRSQAEQELALAREDEKKWKQKESEMYSALAPYSGATLHSKLRAATIEAEQISEALADSFLEGGGMGTVTVDSVNKFVRDYRQVRRIYHLRKERLGRWDEERVAGQLG
ncbi:hypothetical protein V1511DRAFT_491224 [Dipodascopsis uninucleata]